MSTTVTIKNNVVDTYTDELKPNKVMKQRTRIRLRSGASNNRRGWIFPARAWPVGALIISAKLRVWNGDDWTSSATLTVQAPTTKWSVNKIKYSESPTVSGVAVSVTKATAAPDTMWEFDVTSIVNTASLSGNWFGLRIITDATFAGWLHSTESLSGKKRPQLIVEYSEPSDLPDAQSPAGGRSVSIQRPTFTARYNDESGDSIVKQQVQFGASVALLDAGTTTWDSGEIPADAPEFNSAVTGRLSDGTLWPGLADAAVAAWRVQYKDGAGQWSGWSTSELFRRDVKGTLVVTNPSVELVETNYAWNPSAETGTTGWGFWQGTGGAASLSNPTDGGKFGSRYARVTWTVASTSVPDISVANAPQTVVAAPGEAWSGSMWVRPNVTKTIECVMRYKDSGGATITTLAGPATVCPANVWTRVIAENKVAPALTASVRLDARPTTNAAATDILDGDGAVLVKNTTVPDYFSGDSVSDNLKTYAWTGTANGSTSTYSVNKVFSVAPTITWTLTGRVQIGYQVTIAKADRPENILWDSEYTTSTSTSCDVPLGVIDDIAAVYVVVVYVYDTINREATPGDPIHVSGTRQFIIDYHPTNATVTALGVASDPLIPAATLNWTRAGAVGTSDYVILRSRDAGVTWKIIDEVDEADVLVSGTSYAYKDVSPPAYKDLMWRVVPVASNNGKMTTGYASVSGTVRRLAPFLYRPDGSDAVCFLNPERPRVNTGAQELITTLSGDNVLVTQHLGLRKGSVVGRLVGDVLTGVSADDMLERFLRLKDDSGTKVFVALANETIKCVAYNFLYDPRTDTTGVTYDARFDWAEIR